MNERLLDRLDALGEVAAGIRTKLQGEAAGIRTKLQGEAAGQLDGLAVAHLLVAVDAAVKRLGKLGDELAPVLFPPPNENDESDAAPEPPDR